MQVSARIRGKAAQAAAVACLGALVLLLTPAAAAAQTDRYALLVQGASGEDQYATVHRAWLDDLASLLRDELGFDPAKVLVLAETPGPGETRATADAVAAAFDRLAAEVGQDDLLFVMLIGHGSGQGPDAKFNLIGRDLTVSEWSALVDRIRGRIAFVDATSSSYPYLAGLSKPGRVVVTATRSATQRYHTQFGGAFVAALRGEAADADKNQRISLLEAFTHASRLVSLYYEEAGTMATENASFDDTGDGVGRTVEEEGPDGDLAALTYLDVPELPTSSDPEVQALINRQAALTAEIDELRRNRAAMGEATFALEFERLIIELSLVSRDVRRRIGGGSEV